MSGSVFDLLYSDRAETSRTLPWLISLLINDPAFRKYFIIQPTGLVYSVQPHNIVIPVRFFADELGDRILVFKSIHIVREPNGDIKIAVDTASHRGRATENDHFVYAVQIIRKPVGDDIIYKALLERMDHIYVLYLEIFGLQNMKVCLNICIVHHNLQSIGSMPLLFRNSLHFEKCLQPKKP